jgi:FKBP-type peptidyl-prolyl cis-trans isomerase
MKAVAAVLALALSAPAGGAEPPKAAAQQPRQEAGKPATPAAPAPKQPVDVKRTLYGVGLAIAKSLEVFSLSQAELDHVLRGIRDGWAEKPKAQLDAKMQAAVNDLARQRAPKAAEKAAAKEKAAGGPYLAKVAKEKGAKRTGSGAIVITIVEGKGASPKETDKVKVSYTGSLVNGQVFDSTAGRGPAEFPLKAVVRCWGEALQTMKVGGKAKIVCPPETAYGERGSPPAVPGNAVLTFEVELLDIVK